MYLYELSAFSLVRGVSVGHRRSALIFGYQGESGEQTREKVF